MERRRWARGSAAGRRLALVVDDDDDSLEIIGELLFCLGFDVARVRDGGEALALLCSRRLRPAVILLDVRMENVDGFAFRAAQRQHSELRGIPVVVTSGVTLSARELEALSPVRYLRKPFGLHDLERAMKALPPSHA